MDGPRLHEEVRALEDEVLGLATALHAVWEAWRTSPVDDGRITLLVRDAADGAPWMWDKFPDLEVLRGGCPAVGRSVTAILLFEPRDFERARECGLDPLAPCTDCREPVGWDADELSWRHVWPAGSRCFMVHGTGTTLDAREPA